MEGPGRTWKDREQSDARTWQLIRENMHIVLGPDAAFEQLTASAYANIPMCEVLAFSPIGEGFRARCA